MGLLEYFDRTPQADGALVMPARELRQAEKRLVELKQQTASFLVPVFDEETLLTVPEFDPDRLAELADLICEIDETKTAISQAREKISRIDEVLQKHNISTPDLRHLIITRDTKIKHLRTQHARIGQILGKTLSFKNHDVEGAKKDRAVVEAQQIYDRELARLTPEIEKLTAAIEDLQKVLRDTGEHGNGNRTRISNNGGLNETKCIQIRQ